MLPGSQPVRNRIRTIARPTRVLPTPAIPAALCDVDGTCRYRWHGA
jgi:hypothetical protein